MADDRKVTIALTQLDVMRRSVLTEVPEEQVEEYHSFLLDLETSYGDLSSFRIPTIEVKHRVESFRPASYSRRGPARTTYTKTRYCDGQLFSRKVESAFLYIQRTQPKPQTQPNDYWSKTDDELESLAVRYRIPCAILSPDGQQWRTDRERIIRELVKRDNTLNPKPASHHIHVENMVGSSIQQGSTNSVANINNQLSIADIQQFLAQAKSSVDGLEISDDAREELKNDLQTLDIQVGSKNPKTPIILESLKSVRTILEQAAGSLIAAGLLQRFPPLFGG
jgi:hypothetical protein